MAAWVEVPLSLAMYMTLVIQFVLFGIPSDFAGKTSERSRFVDGKDVCTFFPTGFDLSVASKLLL